MIKVKYILTLVLIYFSVSLYSQSNIDLAFKNFKEKNFSVARDYIDKVITEEGINQDPQVWQLRALIYKRLTKDLGIGARDSAMVSLDRADALDTEKKFADKINGYRKNIVIDYYNDAVVQLKGGKCEESEKTYTHYKDLYIKYVDPNKDFSQQDIEYYLALSSKYEAMAKTESDKVKKRVLMDQALGALNKVLAIEKKNYEANLRIGIIQYNRGVHLILGLTPDVNIEECIATNKKSVDIFNVALPYFLTAYEVNPNKKEIIEGLAGIYTNLNNKEKAKEFVELLKQFDK
jgi:tetratricopeptide (TPR) repeat protein